MRKQKNYFIFTLLVLSVIGIIFIIKEKIKRKKELAEKLAKELEVARQKYINFYKTNLENLKSATSIFNNHLKNESGYFTNYQVSLWKTKNHELFSEIKKNPFEKIQLESEEIKTIETFLNFYNLAEKYRAEFNTQFIKEELKKYSNFFDNIEGKKLDSQQRVAIISDDDNNIIIAGAGSGKTTTTIGKVNYVIDRYKINPEEILLISFTNKSAKDLRDRIETEGVEAKTFHKFGKDVIAEVERKQPSIFDENQFRYLITKFFNEQIKNDAYLKKVTNYFIDYLKQPKSQFEFKDQGEYIQYLKDQNFRTFKTKEIRVDGRVTYKMEVVKSIEECKIANFLLFNSIEYKYEEPYEVETATMEKRQYKPDFSIYQNGQRVYLEHFGISRNGDIPRWFVKENQSYEETKVNYQRKMNWARELHNENETVLLETYSYEIFENILFDNLTNNLIDAGIELIPKTDEEIWEIIKSAAEDDVNAFVTLFQTFITLMKSNNYSIHDVVQNNNEIEDSFQRQRNLLFIEIIRPIYEKYENYLSDKKEIDFNDMINKASKYISDGLFTKNFKYVIIDEFQDISKGRYKLVKSIKEKNPECKLFCVGDDWQSIYRFSGSDIALFKEFEDYFGYTVKSRIETTYRFFSPLLNLSSEFIQKNPNQARKELKSTTLVNSSKFKIFYSHSEKQKDTNALKEIFDELIASNIDIENKGIFILGRYGFDVERLTNEYGIKILIKEFDLSNGKIIREYPYSPEKWKHLRENEKIIVRYQKTVENRVLRLDSEFLTVHKAKGLENDIIIILNCNSGKHGFPSEMSDDTVLNLLLSEADQYENGEERRLFYVAMTRAKKNVYFIADSMYKSKFIAELEVESGQIPAKKCPSCITADVVLRKTGIARNGNSYKFYGCTNYLYGCKYTTTEWENQNLDNIFM